MNDARAQASKGLSLHPSRMIRSQHKTHILLVSGPMGILSDILLLRTSSPPTPRTPLRDKQKNPTIRKGEQLADVYVPKCKNAAQRQII